MSLFSVPFYPSLVDQEVNGVKLTTVYVLLIGAIIAHSNGKMNCCVASVETLAEEIGSTADKVRNIRSQLITAGVVEALERDRSNYIVSMKVNDSIVCEILGKSELKAFNKKLKPFQQKVETQTGVVTGVGDNIIDTKNKNNENESEEPSVHMTPLALYSRMKSIYHVRRDADKKKCIEAVSKLQEVFDDDVILDAAKYFYDVMRLSPKRLSDDGDLWWPDFFWVLNPSKLDRVVNCIKKVPGLFGDSEQEAESETHGYMEGVEW